MQHRFVLTTGDVSAPADPHWSLAGRLGIAVLDRSIYSMLCHRTACWTRNGFQRNALLFLVLSTAAGSRSIPRVTWVVGPGGGQIAATPVLTSTGAGIAYVEV